MYCLFVFVFVQGGDGSPPTTVAPELRYQDVMKRLVSRYIHRYKAKQKADGVNEDDLNEIKQDISSLRSVLLTFSQAPRRRGGWGCGGAESIAISHLEIKIFHEGVVQIQVAISTTLSPPS